MGGRLQVGKDWQNAKSIAPGGSPPRKFVAAAFSGAVNNDDCAAIRTDEFTPDQFVEGPVFRDVAYAPAMTHEIVLYLRCVMIPNFFWTYEFNYACTSDIYQLARWNGAINSNEVIPSAGPDTNDIPATDDVMRLEIRGGLIRYLLNGALQNSWIDTLPTASIPCYRYGKPGAGYFIRTDASADVEKFCLSSVTVGSLGEIPAPRLDYTNHPKLPIRLRERALA